MTPAEGAFYLGVPNLIMVRYRDRSGTPLPLPPYDQYALSFRPLRRVVWSCVHEAGVTDPQEVQRVVDLARANLNICGAMMDDFFYDESDKRGSAPAVHTPDEVRVMRDRLGSGDRPLDLWVVLYRHQLSRPVKAHLDHCDVINFWTWHAKDLRDLEASFGRRRASNHGAEACHNAGTQPIPRTIMAMQVSELKPVPTEPVATRFRRIHTPIPVPASIAAIERLRAVEPQSMAGLPPVIWHRAQGFQVEDPYGNRWIDLTSGAAAANAGHGHPRIVRAVREQLDAQLLFTYAFPSHVRARLIERIARMQPRELDRAIAFCSGTEANECALTLMRRHGLSISPDKSGILSFSDTFYGRTLGARFAGGLPGTIDAIRRERVFQTQLPLPGSPRSRGFAADLAEHGVDPERTAGIIFESIPSVTTTLYPQAYVEALMSWARENAVLVAVDEIQVGMGRTGRLFAFEHYGITPDLIAMGKGVSSSLPVSVVKGRAHVMNLAPPGEMSSTQGGNPVCMAAALANLEVFDDEDLVHRSADLGGRLAAWLRPIAGRHPGRVERIDGRGLWHSIRLREPHSGAPAIELADAVAMECVRRGVMSFVTGRGFFKIAPPLVIDADALEEAVSVLGEVLDALLA